MDNWCFSTNTQELVNQGSTSTFVQGPGFLQADTVGARFLKQKIIVTLNWQMNVCDAISPYRYEQTPKKYDKSIMTANLARKCSISSAK